jgi:hypothetical protein
MNKLIFAVLLISGLVHPRLNAQQLTVADEKIDSTGINNSPKWFFGLNGGYGQRLYRSGMQVKRADINYHRNLKSGIFFGGELGYFPWKKVGIGLKYDRYQSKAETEKLSEDVTIQFMGASLIHRAPLGSSRTSVLTSLLLGYQPYQNNTVSGEDAFTFRGKTMGWGISVGLERRLSRKFAIHLTGTAIMGAAYRLTRETAFSTETLKLSKDDSVDLSRASVTLGFRF